MSKFKGQYLLLHLTSRLREEFRRMYPEDSVNYERLSETLHSLAWRIKEKDDEQKETRVSSKNS